MQRVNATHRPWRSLAILMAFLLAIAALAASPVGAASPQIAQNIPEGSELVTSGHHPDGRPGDGQPADFVLTVLHNNDGESALLADEVETGGFEAGVAYFASVVRDAKRESAARTHGDFARRAERGTIFVSSGDNFLAGPVFQASLEDGVYYDAMALDALGYDAIDLGNHDFDFGPDILADFISTGFRQPGDPPYLSSNLDFSGEPSLQALVDRGAIAKSTVVWEQGHPIGIIGATTPALPFVSSPGDVVVDPDVAAAIQEQVDLLESLGVNKIVLISHLQSINEDIELAAALTGVDIMVAGGGDELLASQGDPLLPSETEEPFGDYPLYAVSADGSEVPVVTTTGQYGYLGQLVVGFDRHGQVIDVDDDASLPRRVVSPEVGPDGVTPQQNIQSRIVDPVEEFVAALDTTIVATSEVDLDGIRANVRTMETNEGNLIADSQLWQATQLADEFGVPVPDVALQNGGGIRNDSIIPAGDISLLDTFSMVPFGNFVTVVPDIPREQFKEILENAVSNIENVDGRFAQVAGFSFTFDLNGTAQELDDDLNVVTPGSRIIDVTLDDGTSIVAGGAVVAGDALTIAIVDFLARGGDQYPFRGAPFTAIGVSYQQALANYLEAPTSEGGLGGLISAADYPFGGEGRIVDVTPG